MSLTADEFRRLARCCEGTAWSRPPSKLFLVRLLHHNCPTAAAKIRKMNAQEVEALCRRLAPSPAGGRHLAALLPA